MFLLRALRPLRLSTPLRRFSSSLSKAEKVLLEQNAPERIRNIAIIAHVDHGKTTLVDCLLRHSGISFQTERAMDSNALEQERGITILSKCTSVTFSGHKINIVDTPGHADFGGEVERIMGMVDAVCLVVCASEGPMPQTKFVLRKALEQNLRPLVVINKVDRDTARVDEVESQIFDLFCELDANQAQLEYPTVYASAKNGWAIDSLEKPRDSVADLLNLVIEHTPAPAVQNENQDLVMLVSQTESNPIFGKTLIGRVHAGSIGVGDKVCAMEAGPKQVDSGRILKVLKRYGTQNIELQRAYAGDIVSIAGLQSTTVTNTLNPVGGVVCMPSIPIDPPLISMTIIPNDSPLNGKEGEKQTMLQIRERVYREAENDVSLRVEEKPNKKDEIKLYGRGDLHLGILVEKMRRQGFELAISPPEVVMKKSESGQLLEPVERFTIECDVDYMNTIIERMMPRKGELETTEDISASRVKLTFTVPARGLIGLRTAVVQETKGTAIVQTEFLDYEEHRGDLTRNLRGAIISTATGTTTHYALRDIETKGALFIGPGVSVYEGMVIGEHTLEADMEMNPTKAKKLTNVRAAGLDEQIRLQPPRRLTLEDAVAYIRPDELLEVTPKNIRIRKTVLEGKARQKSRRDAKSRK